MAASKGRLILTYILGVGLPLMGLVGILYAGRHVTSPLAVDVTPRLRTDFTPLASTPWVTLIIQIVVIISVSRLLAFAFQKMQQPKVVGEMFAGLMLGPSLLGWIAPHLSAFLFPQSSLGYLNALSQVGIVIYMFLVGLAMNPQTLRERGHAAVLVSHVSIIIPFLLGALLAFALYPRFSNSTVSFTGFALFMGAAMSITAFPVLGRILTDRNMLGTKLGSLAITCAAVDDVSGWCILAYIVIIVHAHQQHSVPLWATLAGLGAYLAIMLIGIKRLLRRLETIYRRERQIGENLIAVMIVVLLASSLITEKLGLHLLFGSFLAGVSMPKDRGFVQYIQDRFESATIILLVPLFFAFTGLRTSINLIQGTGMWVFLLAILVVGISGKLGGSMLAARAAGCAWRESAGLGILMNTRGLMQLVILNIGYDIGVISPPLFSMMVFMALATTFMTTPLLELVYPMRLIRQRPDELPAQAISSEPA